MLALDLDYALRVVIYPAHWNQIYGEKCMRINKLFLFIFWIFLFESVGMFLGVITKSDISTWYMTLNRSQLTPPGYVFSIVWTILYAVLAYVAWVICINYNSKYKKLVILFSIQMILNWAWTPIFFTLHSINLSAIWIVILVVVNVLLILEAKNINKKIVYALIPYIIWLIFAAYLNLIIVLSN